MAIAMARQGGLGVLHRNLSVDGAGAAGRPGEALRGRHGHQADHHRAPAPRSAEVDALCGRFRISGVPVVDADGVLVGIVTNRDLRFETDYSRLVRRGHDPDAAGHRPASGCSGEDAMALLRAHKVEKLPLVDAAGRLKGLITVKDFVKSEQYPLATKDADGRLGRRRGGRGRRRRVHAGRRCSSRPASTCSSSTRRTATPAPCSRWCAKCKSPTSASRSSAATSPPAPARRRWSTPAPTGSRSGVGPGLDLHHPGRRRRGRAAGHRDQRGRAGGAARRASR